MESRGVGGCLEVIEVGGRGSRLIFGEEVKSGDL